MSITGDRFLVVIEPKGWEFDATGAMSVMEAARFSGFGLPASCRNGTCRTCMCRLVSGQVKYHIAWPGLSKEEKEDGYILPCVAYPESDIVINAPAAVALDPQR